MITQPTSERLITPRFALVVVVGLLYFLSLGMMLPVVPLFVRNDLGGDDGSVGIVVGAFAVGAVLLRPFAGRVGDRFGRKVLIVAGAATVGASALLYLTVSAVVPLVAIRILGGIGEAAFFVGAGTMITDLSPVERRGEAISYWSVAVYGGLAFGPFIGEFVLDHDRYARVWTVAAVLAFVAAALGLFTRESIAAELRTAPRAPQPLLHRSAIAPGAVLFLGLVGLAGFFEFVPLYVGQIGMDQSRGVFLLYGVAILLVRIFGAKLPDRLGSLAAGTIATGVGAAGLVVIAAVPSPVGLFAGTLVFAIGMAFLYPSILTLALQGVPDRERGSAVGTVSSFFDLSQGLGAAMLGQVARFGGYRGAFLGGAVLACAGLALLRAGIDPRTRPGAPRGEDVHPTPVEAVEPDLP